MKMKHLRFIPIILVIFITSFEICLACNENQPGYNDCIRNEFKTNPDKYYDKLSSPTPEDFNRLTNPTVTQLEKVSNPTLNNFNKLDSKKQSTYLLKNNFKNYNDEFTKHFLSESRINEKEIKPGDISHEVKIISNYYFSYPENLNHKENRELRFNYFRSNGYEFTEFSGDVKNWVVFSQQLETKNGNFELVELKKDYKFKVDKEGNFFLIPKKGKGVEYKLSGTVYGYKNKFNIKGTLNGQGIEAEKVVIQDGIINAQEIKEINGIKVKGKPVSGVLNPKTNEFFVNNAFLSEVPVSVRLTGENIGLPNGNKLISGTTKKTSENSWKVFGASEFITENKEKIKTNNIPINIYLNSDNFDPLDHEEDDYYLSTNQRILIHTTPPKEEINREVTVEYQPGHVLFDIFKHKLEDGKLTDVKDDKQGLTIKVSNGDILDISDRQQQNKIPEILQKSTSGSGETFIKSGRLSFNVKDDKINFIDIDSYGDTKEDVSGILSKEDMEQGYLKVRMGRYRSVPFQIKNENGEYLRINSGNQYKIFKENEKAEVVFNDYGIEISDDLEKNRFRSIDDLRSKYPNINFVDELAYWDKDANNGDGKWIRFDDDVDPSLIQIIDTWLIGNPHSINKIGTIRFNPEFNAYSQKVKSGKGILGFGERVMDPYTSRKIPIRGIGDVFPTIIHEFEHLEDNQINNKETRKLAEIEELYTDDFVPDDIRYRRLSELYTEITFSEFKKISRSNEFKNIHDEIRLKKEVMQVALKLRGSPLGGTATDGKKDITMEYAQKEFDSFNEKQKEYFDEVSKLDVDQLEKKYSAIDKVEYSMTMIPHTVKDGKLVERGPGDEMPGYFQLAYGNFKSARREYKDFDKEFKSFEELLKLTGLPSFYTFRDYSGGFMIDYISDEEKRSFDEVSTTYAELPIEIKKEEIRKGNKIFEKLAQIRCDTGKDIGCQELQQVRPGYCQDSKCCDKRCIEYKLLCEAC